LKERKKKKKERRKKERKKRGYGNVENLFDFHFEVDVVEPREERSEALLNRRSLQLINVRHVLNWRLVRLSYTNQLFCHSQNRKGHTEESPLVVGPGVFSAAANISSLPLIDISVNFTATQMGRSVTSKRNRIYIYDRGALPKPFFMRATRSSVISSSESGVKATLLGEEEEKAALSWSASMSAYCVASTSGATPVPHTTPAQ